MDWVEFKILGIRACCFLGSLQGLVSKLNYRGRARARQSRPKGGWCYYCRVSGHWAIMCRQCLSSPLRHFLFPERDGINEGHRKSYEAALEFHRITCERARTRK